MFRFSYSLVYICSLLLISWYFSACQGILSNDNVTNKTTTAPPKKLLDFQKSQIGQFNQVFQAYEEHLTDYDTSIYFRDWSYDPVENNIVCKENKEATLEAYNHKLGLGFKDYIAKENRKTLRYKAVSPFANMENTALYAPEKPLRINGKLFSGVLIGTHMATGKRLIEARFYRGVRIGVFKVWTNLGRLHEKNFGSNQLQYINQHHVRKPVIYLYPTTTQMVSVKVDFKGDIIHSYPKYVSNTGWQVSAQADGTLTDLQTGKEYGYLFWEGKSDYHYPSNTGFVVKGEQTAHFLDEKLAVLGLNRAEATDFITYWLPELESNPYNLIHFATTAYEEQAPLSIQPQPTSVIRVFMVYQPLEQAITIPEQPLATPSRKGFTVVEWGGKKEMLLWPAL
ncbi:MAG: hypothetical protein AB8E82_14330 [Aureispira sp.]